MVKAKKTAAKKSSPKETVGRPEKSKTSRFFEATGRRKTAVARVRLEIQGGKEVLVNGKVLDKYFPAAELQQIALSPLKAADLIDKFSVVSKIRGGGLHAQAEALRHGIARALTEFDQEFRKKMKKAGFLTRDPRMRERKKFGLKRARRAPQWTKR